MPNRPLRPTDREKIIRLDQALRRRRARRRQLSVLDRLYLVMDKLRTWWNGKQ